MQHAAKNVVELRNVSKVYQQGDISVTALNDINLNVADGSFISLCGPSGSGKSTLLNLIGGLDRATGGTINVANQRVDLMTKSELADLRLHSIGFIFQSYNLLPVLSARENVEFIMQLQGVDAVNRKNEAFRILEEVGLKGLENRYPGELSGGQQQRVAVARAIVSKPSIVLADEPTANLDSKTAEDLLKLMKNMNSQHHITFIFSTHDKLVMQYAERIVKLKDGLIESDSQ